MRRLAGNRMEVELAQLRFQRDAEPYHMPAVADQPAEPPAEAAANGRESWHDYPWYAPRFWHGMTLPIWLAFLARNRFAVHPARWMMAVTVTCFALGNSFWGIVQSLLHGRAIRRTKIEEPPVFIIGHWRSGTTLLHELMMRDPRFTAPTNLQCYVPQSFIMLTPWVTRFFSWMLPSKRPMDNMTVDWNAPQEDEFAMCSLGARSPYLSIAFPKHPPVNMEYYNLRDVPAEDLRRWKDKLHWFVQAITYHTGRRVLLKSPPHTGRVRVLRKMFPGAKFIHISRHPFTLYPSTVRLWRALHFAQGFHLTEGDNHQQHIFDCFERMYGSFDEDIAGLAEDEICFVRYEDVASDPVAELRSAYEQLQLGKFEDVAPALEEYVESRRDYQPNKHQLDADTADELARQWTWYFERFGYEVESA